MIQLKNHVLKVCVALSLLLQFCATGADQVNDAFLKKDQRLYKELLLKVSSTDEMIRILKSMEKQPDETHLEFLRAYKEVFTERNLLDTTDTSARSNEGFDVSRRQILQDFVHGMLGLIHGETEVPITFYSTTANGRPLCEPNIPHYYPTLAAETSEAGQYAAWLIAIYCGDLTSITVYLNGRYRKVPQNWPVLLAVYYSGEEKKESAKKIMPVLFDRVSSKPSFMDFTYEEPTRNLLFHCVGCVEYLLTKKTSVRNASGYETLRYAVLLGESDLAMKLIRAGAPVNPTSQDFDWTPLMYAARDNHISLVKILIKSGAKVNTKSPNGETALSLARYNQNAEVIDILRRAGAR